MWAVLLLTAQVMAQDTIFTSELGYGLTLTPCWEPLPLSAEPLAPSRTSPVFFAETKKCERPRLNPEASNGLVISSVSIHLKSVPSLGAVERDLKRGKIPNLAFKRHKQNGKNSVTYVEKTKSGALQWRTTIYGKQRVVEIQGPSIMDPPPEVLARIKAGDVTRPEPEKTLADSVKVSEIKKR